MQLIILLIAAVVTSVSANGNGQGHDNGHSPHKIQNPWFPGRFSNFLVFGDSYTDESRLSYFTSHNNTPPPPGQLLPESLDASDGGRVWPRYVSQYSGATLYDYAIAGGVCTNRIVPPSRATPKDIYAAILETEIPTWLADSHWVDKSKMPYERLYTGSADNTIYAMWIGVNDIGKKNIFIDSQTPGTSLETFPDCVFTAFDSIYKNGGRSFVLMNTPPLQLHPLYATPENDGLLPGSSDWPDKPSNITEVSYKMFEYTQAVNDIWKYQVPFEQHIANRYPGARWAIYDVNSLLTNIHQNPSQYLNGTAPLNVTAYIHHCSPDGETCQDIDSGSPDSFMFYDSLHPSEQVHRIVAQNFMTVVKGTSQYATYW